MVSLQKASEIALKVILKLTHGRPAVLRTGITLKGRLKVGFRLNQRGQVSFTFHLSVSYVRVIAVVCFFPLLTVGQSFWPPTSTYSIFIFRLGARSLSFWETGQTLRLLKVEGRAVVRIGSRDTIVHQRTIFM